MEGYDLDAMHGSGGGGSRKRARADAAQRTDRDLDALHRTGEREASAAQRSGKRKKKGNARERGFAKRAARDQRKRIEELNANRDQPKRRSKAERARSRASPRTLPFERCFWRDLPAPAPTWRQQIGGSAAREAALKATRKALAVVVKGDCPPPIASAADPHLPPYFAAFFAAAGFDAPSQVQRQCWPAALTGADVLGIAPTGSGKTVAFLLPAVPHIQAQLSQHGPLLASEGPISLVLVPTRELAQQVAAVAKQFRKGCGLRTLALYGGGREGKDAQLEALYSVHHLLVATPGRLVELLITQAVTLDRVTLLAIDEADRMLELGFEEQLNAIAEAIRPDRQTLLFSATFPGKLRAAAARWLGGERTVSIRCNTLKLSGQSGDGGVVSAAAQRAERAEAGSQLGVSSTIRQAVRVCAAAKRTENLVALLQSILRRPDEVDRRQPSAVLVFCSRIKTVRKVDKHLQALGVRSGALHGQLDQPLREKALADFKAGALHVLLTTDVAARGLHLKSLRHVVNYEMAPTVEMYTHRIGRTGRQGAKGYAYTLFSREEREHARGLVRLLRGCAQPVDPQLQALAQEAEAEEVQGAAEQEEETEAAEDSDGSGSSDDDASESSDDDDEDGDSEAEEQERAEEEEESGGPQGQAEGEAEGGSDAAFIARSSTLASLLRPGYRPPAPAPANGGSADGSGEQTSGAKAAAAASSGPPSCGAAAGGGYRVLGFDEPEHRPTVAEVLKAQGERENCRARKWQGKQQRQAKKKRKQRGR